MSSWLFWVGIVLLVDGSVGMLFAEKLKHRIKGFSIVKLAWVEVMSGWLLLGLYLLTRSWI
jgi:hypothetical protein